MTGTSTGWAAATAQWTANRPTAALAFDASRPPIFELDVQEAACKGLRQPGRRRGARPTTQHRQQLTIDPSLRRRNHGANGRARPTSGLPPNMQPEATGKNVAQKAPLRRSAVATLLAAATLANAGQQALQATARALGETRQDRCLLGGRRDRYSFHGLSRRRSRHLSRSQDTLLPGVTVIQCLMRAPPQIAKWSEEHPGWHVERWQCGDASREQI